MFHGLTRDQLRQIDRRATEEYGVPSLILMENAGRGAADALCCMMYADSATPVGVKPRVLVCCGKGNNAGDGFVLARHLDLRGNPVRAMVWATPEELRGDAGVNFHILCKAGMPVDVLGDRHDPAMLAERLAWADFVVDALLGTGARGEPRPPLDAVIDQINAGGKPILAIDLPSGLDCDTGEPARHTIRAAGTCTFVAAKRGFYAPGRGQFTGSVFELDIGAPRKLVDEYLSPT